MSSIKRGMCQTRPCTLSLHDVERKSWLVYILGVDHKELEADTHPDRQTVKKTSLSSKGIQFHRESIQNAFGGKAGVGNSYVGILGYWMGQFPTVGARQDVHRMEHG